jgi:hypothetical protein
MNDLLRFMRYVVLSSGLGCIDFFSELYCIACSR